MIDAVVDWSVRRRSVVFIAAVLLAAFGGWAYVRLPIDAIPDLSENQQLVYAEWPNHSPWEIEARLTFPLTLHLQGIEGVRTIRGSSEVDFSLIHIIFEEGVGYEVARRRVTEALAQPPELPAGVAAKIGPNGLPTGQIFWYTIEGGGLDLGELRSLQDTVLGPQLTGVPGVAEVAGVGGFKPEYHIEVDPVKLRVRGVTLQELAKAVERSNAAFGGLALRHGNAEFVVRADGTLGGSHGFSHQASASSADDSSSRTARLVRELENIPIQSSVSGTLKLSDVATAGLGGGPRRGALEKDGREVVGGVVLMRQGENPREVCQRIRTRIAEIATALPAGVRILPAYDRTMLIDDAVRTVLNTLWEAMAVAALAVLVVLLHPRTVFAVVVALPLSIAASFAGLWTARELLGWSVDVNIMSLAGLAVSVGVLVDSSMVLVENSMVRLREKWGAEPVRGDTPEIVSQACRTMGRPILFSILVMLLSFLPLLALGGIEGRMFRPLILTKTLALAAVAVLAITLIPALCSVFIKGRLRPETDSWIVRTTAAVYRPLLTALLDRPLVMLAIIGVTLLVGFAPIGSDALMQGLLFALSAAVLYIPASWISRTIAIASFVVIALAARTTMTPLESDFLAPLNEQMVMDMPITVPRATIEQAVDDLKARNMILCRFPEVAMVLGKAGRADTATDPAPLDMIETMVDVRPIEYWPKRAIDRTSVLKIVESSLHQLSEKKWIVPPTDIKKAAGELADEILSLVEVQLRETAYQAFRQFERELGPAKTAGDWRGLLMTLNAELHDRAAMGVVRHSLEMCVLRWGVSDKLRTPIAEIQRWRDQPPLKSATGHHGKAAPPPAVPPTPEIDSLQMELTETAKRTLRLSVRARDALLGFGGELDRAVSMPGWTNVWTTPIQNRIDMLATGVNTTVGIRVLGSDFDSVVRAADLVAARVAAVPGAASVVADPIRGKGYLDIRVDRDRANARGISAAAITEAVEIALGGRVSTVVADGRERKPVRIQAARSSREDVEAIGRIPVSIIDGETVSLAEVAEIELRDGPAAVKSENGRLRSYVRFNARDGDIGKLVADSKAAVADLTLPAGVHLEWTGQFEHQIRARTTLLYIIPAVLLVIAVVLYWTFHDWADAFALMLAIPGALAGGGFCQWVMGIPFSVTVWVGYIACFGMATATGVVMLVFLRESVDRAGPLATLTPTRLREAVVDGAVQRLRPKLLTEATMLLSLAPMLWATGVGSEVVRPMAAPVLGGVLIADEVIDLFLPAVFLWIRRRRLLKEQRSVASES
jgi:copper/silver efflux system protein